MSERVVLALGGNAILQPEQKGTYEEQKKNIEQACQRIIELVKGGYQVIVTHGNGPQVGQILLQNELAQPEIPTMPLWVCTAESQGMIGSIMQKALKNEINRNQLDKHVSAVLSLTEVDADDPAFNQPTKPVGAFYSKEEADRLAKEKGWIMMEDAGRGYRRVVPSPKPKRILGLESVKTLLENNTVVISAGGGGIPVIRDQQNNLQGISAVIDKDLSALELSKEVEADVLMILTDVSNVFINYGQENQQKLETISLAEAEQYYEDGHFSAGSMGPKMKAAIDFARNGKKAIICSLEEAKDALLGKTGTTVSGLI